MGHCTAAFASANWQSARESVDSAGPSAGLRVVATKLHLNNCGLEGRLAAAGITLATPRGRDCRWKSRPAPPQHRSAASTAGGPRMRPNPQRRLPTPLRWNSGHGARRLNLHGLAHGFQWPPRVAYELARPCARICSGPGAWRLKKYCPTLEFQWPLPVASAALRGNSRGHCARI